jgi:acyl-CoA synthetase (AMP-forming)/AMP-acid ligase II
MATATHGSAIVFPSESFNARAALEAVQEEKCTALYGVPTMFLEELSLIETGEISSEGFQHLRTGIAAGSSIPAEIMKKLHKVLNLTELTICYGMTETSPVSAMTTTDDPIDKRIYSVGRLMPHVEAKIVDPVDKNVILPIERRGELAVSGYLLMKEYWADPGKTAEVMIPDDSGKVWMHVSSIFYSLSRIELFFSDRMSLDWRRSFHVTRWIYHYHRTDQRSDNPRWREHTPPRD